ncbi:Imm1 family immunity protein [Streptomyces sp. NPDC051907]|uniref:Imm1 family immunity protein n=1 Tax=Streptomyces sp. NPDC051907 TaxID=3155284 RepID=UPI003423D50B
MDFSNHTSSPRNSPDDASAYYPQEAAIPKTQVRDALEEFCRARTGQRSECIP